VSRWIAALALAAVAGCWRAGPLTLQLAHHQPSDERTSAETVAGCRFAFPAVTDARTEVSRESLGDCGGAVVAEHIPEWVCEGLDTLVPRRLATRACVPVASDPEVVATVAIRRLYVHAVASDLEAVLALDVRYTRRDGDAVQHTYRGSAQKFNWFNASGEVEDVLNRALHDAVRQIAGELRVLCGTTARPPNPD
jgi:uncharacterized lipoprotein YajG